MMTNIIRPICFNNECASNGSDFKVSVCESCLDFFALFSLKAQEIDVPLAWVGCLAVASELADVFPEGKGRKVLRGQVCFTSHLL